MRRPAYAEGKELVGKGKQIPYGNDNKKGKSKVFSMVGAAEDGYRGFKRDVRNVGRDVRNVKRELFR